MSRETRIGECSCCQAEDVPLKDYRHIGYSPEPEWYCDLCAGTMASQFHGNSHPGDTTLILKAICYVGNAILTEIRKGRSDD